MNADKVHVGLTISLDYNNPHLNPYKEFQKYKTHPFIRKYLENGECLAYGAKTVPDGGFFGVPRLTFPGGMLIGDSAGFVNYPTQKGVHTSMKSGMMAAEAVSEALNNNEAVGKELFLYYQKYQRSWV